MRLAPQDERAKAKEAVSYQASALSKNTQQPPSGRNGRELKAND